MDNANKYLGWGRVLLQQHASDSAFDRFAHYYAEWRIKQDDPSTALDAEAVSSAFLKGHMKMSLEDLRRVCCPEQWTTGSYGLFGPRLRKRMFTVRGCELLAPLSSFEAAGFDLPSLAATILEGKSVCGVVDGTEETWAAILRMLIEKWSHN